jgi:hypothetical protein
MKIGIASSMVFSEKMIEIGKILSDMGHIVFMSRFVNAYVGLDVHDKEKLTLYHKNEKDAIKSFWKDMQDADALLVVNLDRRGIKNYIGGNTLMEIGFAYVLGQKIFLMNPIPEIEYYKSEIEATKPVIINGDFSLIK